jgi:hypothetical protein
MEGSPVRKAGSDQILAPQQAAPEEPENKELLRRYKWCGEGKQPTARQEDPQPTPSAPVIAAHRDACRDALVMMVGARNCGCDRIPKLKI